MAQRRSFDRDYLKQEFDKIDNTSKKGIVLYLIGGGAMAFYGLKVATKDIDVILTNQQDLNSLQATLGSIGYKEPNPVVITRPYNEMQTSALLENNDGFRWDLFLTKVCGKLTLSAEMQTRATSLYQGNKLKMLTASKEDLFLFKAITTRDADLDDTRILAQSGLNWDTITQECKNQSQQTGVCWEGALSQNLQDLKVKYGIEAPIEKALRKTAEEKIIETALLGQIGKGNNTASGIAKAIGESPNFVRVQLYKLASRGLVKVDKSYNPHKFLEDNTTLSKR
jgi:hypothetical protein